jgi:hypothetical protein
MPPVALGLPQAFWLQIPRQHIDITVPTVTLDSAYRAEV